MRFLIYVMLAIIILTQVIFCTVPLTIRSGTTKNYPQTDDLDWGDEATNWAQDVTAAINASPTKTQSQSFDAIVGTSTDVSNAIATHNNLISAISSVNANGNIYLLDGTYWQTSTVTINKAISITGQSDGAVIAGTTGITPIIDVTASGVYLNNFRLDEGTASGGIGIQYEAALDKNKIDISATGTFSGGLINNLGNENSLIGHISFGTSDSRFIGSKINGIKITGTENKKITVTDNVSLNQNLLTTSSPTFNALTLTTSPLTVGSYTLSVSGNTALNQPLLTNSAVTFQTVDATTQYKLNGSNVIGYNSGLIALNNFQTVDSTTKGTIQNNITALPNLTSVSGNSFTVSGATTLNQNVSNTAIPTFKSVLLSDGTLTANSYNFEISGHSKINQGVRTSDSPSFQTVSTLKVNSSGDLNLEATNNIARIMGDTANNTENKYILYGNDGNGTNGDNSSGIASSIDGKIAYKNRADNWITLSSVATANQQLSNLSSVSVNTSLIPASQYNLGAVATPWGTSYLVEGNATNYKASGFITSQSGYFQTVGILTNAPTQPLEVNGNVKGITGIWQSVGINTLAPQTPLVVQHVTTDADTTIRIARKRNAVGFMHGSGIQWENTAGGHSSTPTLTWQLLQGKASPTDTNSLFLNYSTNNAIAEYTATGLIGFGTSAASPTTTVQVNGELRIGNTNQAANAAGTGSLRWGTTETAVQYSDGANWNYFAPPGMTIEYAGATCPAGFLLCDGSAISRTTYAALYTAISTTWGTGNGTSTFNIPDLRGIFIRGAGTSSKLANANSTAFAGTLGAYSNDELQGHYHEIDWYIGGGAVGTRWLAGENGIGSLVTSTGHWDVKSPTADGTNGTPRVGLETNPANAALNRCIKY